MHTFFFFPCNQKVPLLDFICMENMAKERVPEQHSESIPLVGLLFPMIRT